MPVFPGLYAGFLGLRADYAPGPSVLPSTRAAELDVEAFVPGVAEVPLEELVVVAPGADEEALVDVDPGPTVLLVVVLTDEPGPEVVVVVVVVVVPGVEDPGVVEPVVVVVVPPGADVEEALLPVYAPFEANV